MFLLVFMVIKSFTIFALLLCKIRNAVQSQLAGGEKAGTASLLERERVEKDERVEKVEKDES